MNITPVNVNPNFTRQFRRDMDYNDTPVNRNEKPKFPIL